MATVVEMSPTSEQSEFVLGTPVNKKTPALKVPSLCSMRYGIAFVTHFCNFTLMAQNSIISITMVAMVNNTDHPPHLNSSTEQLPAGLSGDQHEASKHLPIKAPVYNWSPQTQGIIFSSVQYGMILMQGPGGYLAGKIGTKKVVGIALLGSSLLTLCIPLAANLGLVFFLATRAVQGLMQGTGYGGQFALWQKWAPPNERSRLCTIALSGMTLGIFTVLLVGGIISEALGWPFVFYSFGGGGVLCSLLWFILIYDDPVSHPWISGPEREYILSSLNQQFSSEEQPLPIKAMLKSLPLWSMCLCTMTHQWLVNTFIMYTPTYISSVFKVNIRDNGFLSSLPFIVAWVLGILGGWLADFLLSKNFRLITVRKFITLLGNAPPAALVAALPYIQSSYITTIIFLTISCGLCPLSQAGIYINALDIAPRYASFLMGTSRGLAHSSAVLVPIVAGFFLSQDSEFGWRNFFFVVFAVNLLGLIIYLVFGKADVQEWARERKLTRL
ncbi:sodium-dependent phosphate transport protein 4 isoform X1 [Mus musculus]|uniref:sodium-dependent phosphate transport protein 4 isoform 1 n=2 Tax=Mus musculus TaxID=10090 RepID=UPI0000024BAF|nr:sodium-dependent phosphate transport protein 4 isoform 1 [Mus musculus]XP_006516583.1 sodium-dependent phosphate transport protein 4 isoform X1 [Mus musculus]XP_017170838.1 sodium-dependent phosphate transport protein 4 isoform X1 [Mus musculus]EDL32526.1 solute carrier family 17 (sodium phosphate), member 3, isoform CRA_c [Mus musculus]|eukprot:NP_598830.2 sodium-dependent phosphate transport protein 4 isoform 1 [Mus musculus]